MPRGGSGGRSSGFRSSPAPARRPPPPKNVNQAPPPTTAQKPSGGFSFFESIADGLAWGAGTAVARRVVDAVMGPQTIQYETVVSDAVSASPVANNMSPGACDLDSKAFQNCINDFGRDISMCQFYMDVLMDCRRKSGSIRAA